jgi:hypothetical protein
MHKVDTQGVYRLRCYAKNCCLFRLLRNDQQNLDRGHHPVLVRRPKLPLLQRAQQELHLGKLGWKHQGQTLELAFRVHETMNQQSIGIVVFRVEAWPHHVVGPWRIRPS